MKIFSFKAAGVSGVRICLLSCLFLRDLGFMLKSILFDLSRSRMTSYDSQYPWAPLNLKRECTGFCTERRIQTLREKQALCKDDENDVVVGLCELDEPVCRDGTLLPLQTFTFVYVTLFERLGFRLPFNDFEKGLLTALNVVPAQLHPNSWAFVRAFHILCSGLGIRPTPNMFLYFFELKNSSKLLWTSLNGVSGRALFALYQSSYKGFKGAFIKILAPSHNPTLLEGFPLYWTKNPSPKVTRQLEDLNPADQKGCEELMGLEVIFDIRKILELEYREVDLRVFIGINLT